MRESDVSRRSTLHFAVATAVSVLGVPTVAQGFTKSPKKSARYQDHPNGGQRCGNCRQFQPPSSCKVVAGNIDPNGWCALYFAR
jgi:hypothetical protein